MSNVRTKPNSSDAIPDSAIPDSAIPDSAIPDSAIPDSTDLSGLRARLETDARRLGFVRLGVAEVSPLAPEAEQLRNWLCAGFHGDMTWLATTEAVRADVRHEGMLPSAERVLVLATPYGSAFDRSAASGPIQDEAQRGAYPRIARYARGRDYHTVLGKRLRKLVRTLREEGYQARASVDSLPVLERAWAQRAGVGFVGKNCCLIVPGIGSHVFLSAIVTNAKLPSDAPMAPRCGSCRACLDACPTRAFAAANQLDARRCIAYLTIEAKGATPELEEATGAWLFGCDVCQDVCPYNGGQARQQCGDSAFDSHERWTALDPAAWLEATDEKFREMSQASPCRRPGRDGMARNAAVVLGNTGNRRHLQVLERAATHHDSAMVREVAGRAAERLRTQLDSSQDPLRARGAGLRRLLR